MTELSRLPPGEHYRRDPMFATLVNHMRGIIHAGEFTPIELREAFVYAATMEEAYRERLGTHKRG